jgi:hypothetical protein
VSPLSGTESWNDLGSPGNFSQVTHVVNTVGTTVRRAMYDTVVSVTRDTRGTMSGNTLWYAETFFYVLGGIQNPFTGKPPFADFGDQSYLTLTGQLDPGEPNVTADGFFETVVWRTRETLQTESIRASKDPAQPPTMCYLVQVMDTSGIMRAGSGTSWTGASYARTLFKVP